MFLKAEPLTSAAFLHFGEVIECPAIPGRTYFEDALGSLRPGARPSLSLTVKHAVAEMPLKSTTMERHEFSSQTFIPQDAGRWLVVVAPHDAAGGPDMARARAFLAGPSRASPTAPMSGTTPSPCSTARPLRHLHVAGWQQGPTRNSSTVPEFSVELPDAL